MVYASFDDRQVDTMEYSMYGVPGSTQFQYPVTNQIRYPKVTLNQSNPLILQQYSLDNTTNIIIFQSKKSPNS